ncbi:hypothetical protein FC19_GL001467 [Liquorilactobacillus aquaticus DSM 21051]|uniref:HTH cro/C1-type domain-containing protein n=2 Tax=Liquorilactobacillus aquaticus TaxID=392566 RepID=A0A0R2CWL2_9LACO|nr:hypothetical protein FC19_GL001467 [Liquorilactobacillus aquaticus DSM 21051]
MILHGDNQKKLASYLGISQQRFSAKINEKNGAEFSKSEMTLIKEKYHLTATQINDIFFSNFVSL